MAITHVPISNNPKTRESRRFKSIPSFVGRQLSSMIRMYAMYESLRFFYIGLTLSIIGILPMVRSLYFYFTGDGGGHLQSLVLGGVLIIIGFITFMIGLVANLISFNRQLAEIALEKIRKIELQQRVDDQS